MKVDKKLEDARKLLEQEHKKSLEDCGKEIQAVLKKFGCDMIAQGTFQGNQIQTKVLLIKKNS